MNIEDLLVSTTDARKIYTAAQIMAVLDGAGSAGTARTTMTATYVTQTITPTVYYTALNTDGSILSSRSADIVSFQAGIWQVVQNTVGITDFIAVWDEGQVDDYVLEWITVDT